MRNVNLGCPNFLDKKDSRFKKLHGTLDSHFHHLHSTGMGRKVKHACVLTKGMKISFGRVMFLSTTFPKALQNAVFYTVGKVFSLRSGVEMCHFSTS